MKAAKVLKKTDAKPATNVKFSRDGKKALAVKPTTARARNVVSQNRLKPKSQIQLNDGLDSVQQMEMQIELQLDHEINSAESNASLATKTSERVIQVGTSDAMQSQMQREAAEDKMVELFPYGLSFSSDLARPVMLFKDRTGDVLLPVWVGAFEAGVAAADFSPKPSNVHSLSNSLLKMFNARISRCEFNEVVGHHQYAAVTLQNIESGAELFTVRSRAEEAISLCVAAGARFFSRKKFVARCRELDAELLSLEQTLKLDPKMSAKTHPHMM